MKRRPDGDIEINEKFWEEDFNIPTCRKCKGVLKPNVRQFNLYLNKKSLGIFLHRSYYYMN